MTHPKDTRHSEGQKSPKWQSPETIFEDLWCSRRSESRKVRQTRYSRSPKCSHSGIAEVTKFVGDALLNHKNNMTTTVSKRESAYILVGYEVARWSPGRLSHDQAPLNWIHSACLVLTEVL